MKEQDVQVSVSESLPQHSAEVPQDIGTSMAEMQITESQTTQKPVMEITGTEVLSQQLPDKNEERQSDEEVPQKRPKYPDETLQDEKMEVMEAQTTKAPAIEEAPLQMPEQTEVRQQDEEVFVSPKHPTQPDETVQSENASGVEVQITQAPVTEAPVTQAPIKEEQPQQAPQSPAEHSQTTTAPHIHDVLVEKREATCLEAGFYKEYCGSCGQILKEENASTALGHDFEKSIWELATCQKSGYFNNICKRCGMVECITQNPLPHEVEDVVIQEGNCMEDTVIRHVCKICGLQVDSDTRTPVYDVHNWLTENIDGEDLTYCEWCGVAK